MKDIIKKVTNKENLTFDEAFFAMNEIMSGNVNDILMSAYLIGLKLKGETADEIAGSVTAMRKKAVRVNAPNALDIVGTGGDGHNTFNISSISAIVVSSCGVKVAKHGNRSVSSKCGSADVLDALGININLDNKKMEKIINDINIGFMFAPLYHSSMKYAGPVRKELGVRTIFNIMGPLSNPAFSDYILMGMYSKPLVRLGAEALGKLGVKTAIVINGENGLDEVNPCGLTFVSEYHDDNIVDYVLKPKDFKMEPCEIKDIIGGTPQENKEIALKILKGEKGAKTDAVIMNSALALKAVKKLPLLQCVEMASDALYGGLAYKKLQEFINATNQ